MLQFVRCLVKHGATLADASIIVSAELARLRTKRLAPQLVFLNRHLESKGWLQRLRGGAADARFVADELDKAAAQLTQTQAGR